MGLSKSEAGKLGALKTIQRNKLLTEVKIQEYNKSPILCKECGKPHLYERRNLKFCTMSCAAAFNNKLRGKKISFCITCNTQLKDSRSKFCNAVCQKRYEYLNKVNSWLTTNEYPGKKAVKRWLTETFGYSCAVCGLTDWMGKPIILELEHKDGNSENNFKDNLCLICPNCHSQTPTYKAKNKGNGRHKRMQRYYDGKSY